MDRLILQKLQRALKKLIAKDGLGLSSNDEDEIDVSFLAPNRDFTGKLGSKPTINCYLVGVTEDRLRRQSEPPRSVLNQAKTMRTMYKEPKFVDLTYMLTVWSLNVDKSAEIEHLLLSYLISGLGSYDYLPQELQDEESLAAEPYGIRVTLFGNENSEKISGQVWQALGSTPKPTVLLSLSVPVSVYIPTVVPVIQEIERTLSSTDSLEESSGA